RDGYMTEMDSSIEILDIVLHLIVKYPGNIVYLLGNHDTFSENLSKQGIQQGVLFYNAIVRKRGLKYAELLENFFTTLPLFVKHKFFLATHAGPVRNGVSRDELINVYQYPEYVWQLTWNRINETRSNPSMKEYGPEDLDVLRKLLKCPPDIPVIVGHNPMWKWGGQDSIWINPAGSRDHVILYSNRASICPYLSFTHSFKYEIKYADLRLRIRRFVLDDYA
ncbi:MAG: metallophosphoesterase, partial [Spirochaetota bacterium]